MRSIKKKTEELKNAHSANTVSCVDGLSASEDECDYDVKICETLNKGMICCVKVGIHSSPISSNVKKKRSKRLL